MNEKSRIKDNVNVIGANVARLRKAAGLSQQQLATKVGAKSQNTIAAIETGLTVKSKLLPDIAAALGVGMVELDSTFARHETTIIPGAQLLGERNLEVFGSILVGPDDVVVKTNEPISVVLRPQPLEHVRGGYGLLVVVDSMMPIVRAGDIVLVNPHLPPRLDDICLFIHTINDIRTLLTLKEFRGQNTDSWQVKQYYPKERIFSLSKRDWPKCHVIVGIFRGR